MFGVLGKFLPPLVTAAMVIAGATSAGAQPASPMPMDSGSPMPMSTASAMPMGSSSPMSGASSMPMSGASSMPMSGGSSMMSGKMSGMMDHGMPTGKKGGDGIPYTYKPSLQTAISLVTAGGAPGHFSITKAIASLAGAATANAEVAKLTKQYGSAKVASFVAVQNYAVNDAVKIALAAGVKFPQPMLHGKALAVAVTKYGLEGGTYYEGPMLDHLVTHKIHEQVMDDIDSKFGTAADANYHRIANQAHYDLAQALGATTVGLAAYH